jgi:DNA-binding SARP family transcriptional activator
VAPAGEEQDFSAPMATVSTDDQQFLDQVSGRSAAMKATYESQLRSVNSYIRDAEAYVKRNPADEDARRHLMHAYEQKAMLYQMALDHVQ